MHGCSAESTLLVNAEVDCSMGGVADGRVGTSIKASPHQAAIEKVQAEFRLEYAYREERRRELEFLEKGGNPLDFKYGNATSASVQSTSLTDQHLEQVATSEARGSFALAASPHGDSLESSDRPKLLCGSNHADNQLDSNYEGHLVEGEKNPMRGGRRNKFASSKQSSQFDGSQNAKDSEESAIFRPYARRNRSRPNRDIARSSSADMFHGHGCHGLSLAVRVGFRDPKGSVSETKNHKEENLLMITRPKCASAKGNKRIQSDIAVDGEKDLESTSVHAESDLPGGNLDIADKSSRDNRSTKSFKVDLVKTAVDIDSGVSDIRARENSALAYTDYPSAVVAKVDNETRSGVVNSFADEHSDWRNHVNECQNNATAFGVRGLDSESSCTRTSIGADVHNDCDVYNSSKSACITLNTMMLLSEPGGNEKLISEEMVKEQNDSKSTETSKDEDKSDAQAHVDNGAICKDEEMHESSGPEKKVQNSPGGRGMEQIGHVASAIERDRSKTFDDNTIIQEKISLGRPQGIDVLACEQKSSSSERDPAALSGPKICCSHNLKLVDKAREDRVLEEAQTIEAHRKRIAELSFGTVKLENRRRFLWNYVLEEMAWLANDFAQERVWKMTAAAQLCHHIASASKLRFEEQDRQKKLKMLAFNFTKAVMQFWHVADMLAHGDDASCHTKSDRCPEDGPRKRDDNDLHHDQSRETQKMQGYAMRFLRENSLHVPAFKAEVLTDTDEVKDMEISQLSHDSHLTGDSIFYTISFGAMETYRKSIESCVTQCEEEVNSSLPETVSVNGYQANPYNENERETCMYNLSGAFEGSKLSKLSQKNRKSFKLYTSGAYGMAADLPYGENRMGTQQSFFMGKRAANLDVGLVPPKRMRTASRQRILSPFNGGAGLRGYPKSDASSGDTNSLQDDQSTLHSGSQVQKIMEAESVGGLEKQLPYDSADASIKSKKKKKRKLLSSPYEQDWQLDSTVHIEQRDQLKKRLENRYFESNGTSAKKPKMIKRSLDNTFDNIASMTGSIPSPVASQMSNMSTPNKLVNSTDGRDRSRKVKGFKMSTVQPYSGSLWSLFEDQALIVLVHDMGPNWELVSDAINNTLQFECVFRKPKECKERHMFLMDKNAGDGADSGEDSGSSHSYPSTLPGIPKGSARQLFQRLQGPMMEQALNEHFEKIIRISQKQHYQRNTNDSQNQKQVPVHRSHFVALSQVCPNNLNGVLLTPFDLCETTAPPVYQGSQASNLALSNQCAVPPMLATSGENKSGEISSLHRSTSMVLGPNLLSSTDALTTSCRSNLPRTLSMPVDEQNKMQHYNQMTSPMNIQQPNLSISGSLSVTDCDVRMKPGRNSVVVNSINGSLPMSRSEIHGMTSSSVLNTSSMVGMPSPVNMHPRPDSAQGNSTLKPHEALHTVTPDHISEQQTQSLLPRIQKQVPQEIVQGVPPLDGLGPAFSNRATRTQMYPGHTQQQYQLSSRQPHLPNSPYYRPNIQGQNQATDLPQQTYAIRIAKEGQLQQWHLQRPQQQLAGSNNAVTSHVQPQPQSPILSLQDSSLLRSQPSSQPVPVSPQTPSSPMSPIISPQHPQNYPLQPHALGLNHQNNPVSCSINQTGRQRQHQLQQQQPQQCSRPPPKRQQQKQAIKGIGRGNNLVNRNLSSDPSHLNGLSMAPGSRGVEKGDQVLQFVEGQGFRNPGSIVNNPVRPPKSLVPPNPSSPQLQQTLVSGPTSPVSRQMPQIPSKSDSSSAEHVSSIPNKAITSPLTASKHLQALHIHQQPTQKQVNPIQSSYAGFQPSHPMTSKPSIKSQTNLAQLDQRQRPVNKSTWENTAAMVPQASLDSANAAPGKKSQPLSASCVSAPPPRVGFVGRPLIANTARKESTPSVGQSTEQCREPGGLSSHGRSIDCLGTQLGQTQQQPMMSPLMPRPSPKRQYQLQEQFLKSEEQQEALQKPLPKLPPQQQRQHLQAGQGN